MDIDFTEHVLAVISKHYKEYKIIAEELKAELLKYPTLGKLSNVNFSGIKLNVEYQLISYRNVIKITHLQFNK